MADFGESSLKFQIAGWPTLPGGRLCRMVTVLISLFFELDIIKNKLGRCFDIIVISLNFRLGLCFDIIVRYHYYGRSL